MLQFLEFGASGEDSVTGNFNIHDEILPDYDNAKYILFVANNASIGAVSTCRMVRFAQGCKNGAKVVALDPRRSETAAKADEWIAIRPGTDPDFLLAMMRTVMHEGYYDNEFLRRHTNMPFLLYRDEQGEWQPVLDDQDRPLMLAEGSLVPRIVKKFSNDNQVDIDGNSFVPALLAPEGLVIDGKTLITVFQAQLQELGDFTPEWAAKTIGVPTETIHRVGNAPGIGALAILRWMTACLTPK